jgi:hypothetical protein
VERKLHRIVAKNFTALREMPFKDHSEMSKRRYRLNAGDEFSIGIL